MTAVDALFLSSAAIVAAVGTYRLLLHARRPKPTDVPLLTITFALGGALLVLSPSVQTIESALVPSLGRLLSNVCTLIAAFGLLHLMLYVTRPAEDVPRLARKRLVTLLLAIGVMVTMFAGSTPPPGTGIFAGLYRDQPTLAVYILVYTTYLGIAVTDLASLSLRSIRHTRLWLRAGMILICIGCVLAYAYLGQKVFSILVELLTGTVAEPYCSTPFATVGCTFSVGFPPLAVLAIVLGAALPTLGPHLEHPVRTFVDWRAYRRLQPLWDVVHDALPDPAFASAAAQEGMSERLYQRIIACRDGLLALQPYRTPEDTRAHAAAAADLPTSRRAAVVEAADIRAALHRRQHNELPTSNEATPLRHLDDLRSEIRWLTSVADALTRNDLPGPDPANAPQT